MLISIDPGRSSGYAFWLGRTLLSCGVCTPDTLNAACPEYVQARTAVIEMPFVYPTSPVPPNDLMTLARMVGRYEERFRAAGISNIYLPKPAEWKGQIDKPTHHARVRKLLTPGEVQLVAAAGKHLSAKARLDLLDAVALGLWALRRVRT